jgi:CDP-2,3-bis-(O-geranylgeranyl)-sn-glycerol synthase
MNLDVLARDTALLVLLLVANGSPIVARKLLGKRLSSPLDLGIRFADGHPLLGQSKTLRGVLAAVITTPPAALLLGFDATMGLLIALLAMAGDLLSSFVKRRLGLHPGDRATGLDHLPESLLPMLACMAILDLTLADIALITLAFMLIDMLLSRWLFEIGLRRRPH